MAYIFPGIKKMTYILLLCMHVVLSVVGNRVFAKIKIGSGLRVLSRSEISPDFGSTTRF